jgi:aryl-alcohol dehydrogenase-like predicted oxidoreductase
VNNRLALGTVQFGLPYGIANRTGQVSREAATAIMSRAWAAGVDTLDTAISYGESERRLGEIGVGSWRVVSKLPAIPADCSDVAAWMEASVRESRRRLGVDQLHGLLLHRSAQLLGQGGTQVYEGLLAMRERGEVQKIGVSVYGPEELEPLLPRYGLDLVQAPFNVLDRRLCTSGWLTRLRDAGTEVHARSIFLQGLLLMEPGARPARFERWQSLWSRWHAWLDSAGLTALQACVRFAFANSGFDRLIVGVETREQLEEILGALDAGPLEIPATVTSDDPDLINPSRWNLQ